MLGDLSLVLFAQINFHYQGIISKSKVRAVKTLVKSDSLRGNNWQTHRHFSFVFTWPYIGKWTLNTMRTSVRNFLVACFLPARLPNQTHKVFHKWNETQGKESRNNEILSGCTETISVALLKPAEMFKKIGIDKSHIVAYITHCFKMKTQLLPFLNYLDSKSFVATRLMVTITVRSVTCLHGVTGSDIRQAYHESDINMIWMAVKGALGTLPVLLCMLTTGQVTSRSDSYNYSVPYAKYTLHSKPIYGAMASVETLRLGSDHSYAVEENVQLAHGCKRSSILH